MSKEWDPYFNEYQDRGIIKWQGFFLSEHTSALDRLKKEDEEIPRLPQQSKQAIDHYLSRSIKQNKVIEVQLNTLDDLGRVKPHILGTFRGSDLDVVTIFNHRTGQDVYIDYNDIRHIKMHNYLKWFETKNKEGEPFEDFNFDEETQTVTIIFKDYFEDDNWIE